jgi:hypothetical protein
MTRYWFKPKRYGYGATPVTWEGWVFTGFIVAIVAVSGWLLLGGARAPSLTMVGIWWAIVVLTIAASVAVTKSKTEGSWRWRWGRDL